VFGRSSFLISLLPGLEAYSGAISVFLKKTLGMSFWATEAVLSEELAE